MIPAAHDLLLASLRARIAAEPSCMALLAAGSLASGAMDEHSDLDLVLVSADNEQAELLATLPVVAADAGPLLSAFTGEHVGEPRLLICLYGPPLVHVDLKAVPLADLAHRVDEAAVIWTRDARVAALLATTEPSYPAPDLQWIEDRFWTWVHYGATKLARGELYEANDFLAFLRGRVLGPIGLQQAGAQPNGVRRIDWLALEVAERMAATVTVLRQDALASALARCVALYRLLRDRGAPVRRGVAAEVEVTAYLRTLMASFGAAADPDL